MSEPWLNEAAEMKRRRLVRPIQPSVSQFAGFRFPPDVILIAVRWYLRYGLSYRDLEELLAERGIELDHVTLFRWVQRFIPLLVDAARPCRHRVGDHWFVDETYVKVTGTWRYVYRAVDQYGQVIDVFVSKKRDLKAAALFFTSAIRSHGRPAEITTGRAVTKPQLFCAQCKLPDPEGQQPDRVYRVSENSARSGRNTTPRIPRIVASKTSRQSK